MAVTSHLTLSKVFWVFLFISIICKKKNSIFHMNKDLVWTEMPYSLIYLIFCFIDHMNLFPPVWMLLTWLQNMAKGVKLYLCECSEWCHFRSCNTLDLKLHPLLSYWEEFVSFDRLSMFCFTGIYWFKQVLFLFFFCFIGCYESLGRAGFFPKDFTSSM